MSNPLREHALGVGVAILLIIIGIALIVAGFYLNKYGEKTSYTLSTAPLPTQLAESFTYEYLEYGPLCNVTLPPVPPIPCKIGLLINESGVGHGSVTVPMWVTLQPPSVAQHELIYNFTVIFKITSINGYPTDYIYTFTASAGKYIFAQPNGAYLEADLKASGTSTLTVYVPAAQATVYVVGLGGFPLTHATAVLACGDESAFASTAPELTTPYIPMPNGEATTVPCNLTVSVPVFPGYVEKYVREIALPIGADTIVFSVPVSGIYVPGLGYLGTLYTILIVIGAVLVLIGIILLLFEYYHFRRIRLFKAYGIPPY